MKPIRMTSKEAFKLIKTHGHGKTADEYNEAVSVIEKDLEVLRRIAKYIEYDDENILAPSWFIQTGTDEYGMFWEDDEIILKWLREHKKK